jgi:DNA primase
VSWDELPRIAKPNAYTIADVEKLLRRAKTTAIAKWGKAEQRLPALG